MAQSLESGIAAGAHLHSAISLAPPALCENWPTGDATVEQFDFLAPQQRARRVAAIGGITLAVCMLGLVGFLTSSDASGLEATARIGERTPTSGTGAPQHTALASSQPMQPPSAPAEAYVAAPPSSSASLTAAPETKLGRKARKPAPPMRAKAKLGARKR